MAEDNKNSLDFDKMEKTLVEIFEKRSKHASSTGGDTGWAKHTEATTQTVHAIIALRQERRDSENPNKQRTIRKVSNKKEPSNGQ